jgi:Ca2+-binding RTX toxin-like protein
MSFIDPPSSSIWDQPGNDPANTTTWTGNRDQVDGSTPTQVGGTGNTFTTTDAPTGTSNQVVLSGQENILKVGTGAAEVQSIGQGNIIEAVQVLGDGTKIISTGTFGAGGEAPAPTGVAVSGTQMTTGNVIGQSASINEMAGGMTPAGGFYSNMTGGTGNDLLYGSAFSDFARGGMGKDTIYTYGGNDIVRGGAGSDLISLGAGNDTLYYTFDQLQNDVDVVTDFNAIAGDTDILAIQANRVGGAGNFSSFSGFDTNSLRITDTDGSVTTVQAQAGYAWKQADIFFVV